ncbi:hypothetical protein Cadr_000024987 [Camelus dromedarius]|uniref:Uncharacterized protein n=1 Tax=Camelus dromedarius TaxID=9838 RepID=A0A5N4CPU1_CAMDR|nr:hypothetical protein Cadr_000024987 [Camelus dromedarius]
MEEGSVPGGKAPQGLARLHPPPPPAPGAPVVQVHFASEGQLGSCGQVLPEAQVLPSSHMWPIPLGPHFTGGRGDTTNTNRLQVSGLVWSLGEKVGRGRRLPLPSAPLFPRHSAGTSALTEVLIRPPSLGSQSGTNIPQCGEAVKGVLCGARQRGFLSLKWVPGSEGTVGWAGVPGWRPLGSAPGRPGESGPHAPSGGHSAVRRSFQDGTVRFGGPLTPLPDSWVPWELGFGNQEPRFLHPQGSPSCWGWGPLLPHGHWPSSPDTSGGESGQAQRPAAGEQGSWRLPPCLLAPAEGSVAPGKARRGQWLDPPTCWPLQSREHSFCQVAPSLPTPQATVRTCEVQGAGLAIAVGMQGQRTEDTFTYYRPAPGPHTPRPQGRALARIRHPAPSVSAGVGRGPLSWEVGRGGTGPVAQERPPRGTHTGHPPPGRPGRCLCLWAPAVTGPSLAPAGEQGGQEGRGGTPHGAAWALAALGLLGALSECPAHRPFCRAFMSLSHTHPGAGPFWKKLVGWAPGKPGSGCPSRPRGGEGRPGAVPGSCSLASFAQHPIRASQGWEGGHEGLGLQKGCGVPVSRRQRSPTHPPSTPPSSRAASDDIAASDIGLCSPWGRTGSAHSPGLHVGAEETDTRWAGLRALEPSWAASPLHTEGQAREARERPVPRLSLPTAPRIVASLPLWRDSHLSATLLGGWEHAGTCPRVGVPGPPPPVARKSWADAQAVPTAPWPRTFRVCRPEPPPPSSALPTPTELEPRTFQNPVHSCSSFLPVGTLAPPCSDVAQARGALAWAVSKFPPMWTHCGCRGTEKTLGRQRTVVSCSLPDSRPATAPPCAGRGDPTLRAHKGPQAFFHTWVQTGQYRSKCTHPGHCRKCGQTVLVALPPRDGEATRDRRLHTNPEARQRSWSQMKRDSNTSRVKRGADQQPTGPTATTLPREAHKDAGPGPSDQTLHRVHGDEYRRAGPTAPPHEADKVAGPGPSDQTPRSLVRRQRRPRTAGEAPKHQKQRDETTQRLEPGSSHQSLEQPGGGQAGGQEGDEGTEVDREVGDREDQAGGTGILSRKRLYGGDDSESTGNHGDGAARGDGRPWRSGASPTSKPAGKKWVGIQFLSCWWRARGAPACSGQPLGLSWGWKSEMLAPADSAKLRPVKLLAPDTDKGLGARGESTDPTHEAPPTPPQQGRVCPGTGAHLHLGNPTGGGGGGGGRQWWQADLCGSASLPCGPPRLETAAPSPSGFYFTGNQSIVVRGGMRNKVVGEGLGAAGLQGTAQHAQTISVTKPFGIPSETNVPGAEPLKRQDPHGEGEEDFGSRPGPVRARRMWFQGGGGRGARPGREVGGAGREPARLRMRAAAEGQCRRRKIRKTTPGPRHAQETPPNRQRNASAAGALLAGTPGVSSPGPGTPGAGAERVHSRRGVRGYDTTRCCPLWEGLGRKGCTSSGPKHEAAGAAAGRGHRGQSVDTRGCGLTAGHEPPTPGSRGPSAGAGIRCRGWSSEAVWTRSSTCPPLLYSGPPGPAAGLMVPREPPGRTPCWGCQLRGGKGLHPRTGLDHRAGQGARSQAVLAPDISVAVSSLPSTPAHTDAELCRDPDTGRAYSPHCGASLCSKEVVSEEGAAPPGPGSSLGTLKLNPILADHFQPSGTFQNPQDHQPCRLSQTLAMSSGRQAGSGGSDRAAGGGEQAGPAVPLRRARSKDQLASQPSPRTVEASARGTGQGVHLLCRWVTSTCPGRADVLRGDHRPREHWVGSPWGLAPSQVPKTGLPGHLCSWPGKAGDLGLVGIWEGRGMSSREEGQGSRGRGAAAGPFVVGRWLPRAPGLPEAALGTWAPGPCPSPPSPGLEGSGTLPSGRLSCCRTPHCLRLLWRGRPCLDTHACPPSPPRKTPSLHAAHAGAVASVCRVCGPHGPRVGAQDGRLLLCGALLSSWETSFPGRNLRKWERLGRENSDCTLVRRGSWTRSLLLTFPSWFRGISSTSRSSEGTADQQGLSAGAAGAGHLPSGMGAQPPTRGRHGAPQAWPPLSCQPPETPPQHPLSWNEPAPPCCPGQGGTLQTPGYHPSHTRAWCPSSGRGLSGSKCRSATCTPPRSTGRWRFLLPRPLWKPLLGLDMGQPLLRRAAFSLLDSGTRPQALLTAGHRDGRPGTAGMGLPPCSGRVVPGAVHLPTVRENLTASVVIARSRPKVMARPCGGSWGRGCRLTEGTRGARRDFAGMSPQDWPSGPSSPTPNPLLERSHHGPCAPVSAWGGGRGGLPAATGTQAPEEHGGSSGASPTPPTGSAAGGPPASAQHGGRGPRDGVSDTFLVINPSNQGAQVVGGGPGLGPRRHTERSADPESAPRLLTLRKNPELQGRGAACRARVSSCLRELSSWPPSRLPAQLRDKVRSRPGAQQSWATHRSQGSPPWEGRRPDGIWTPGSRVPQAACGPHGGVSHDSLVDGPHPSPREAGVATQPKATLTPPKCPAAWAGGAAGFPSTLAGSAAHGGGHSPLTRRADRPNKGFTERPSPVSHTRDTAALGKRDPTPPSTCWAASGAQGRGTATWRLRTGCRPGTFSPEPHDPAPSAGPAWSFGPTATVQSPRWVDHGAEEGVGGLMGLLAHRTEPGWNLPASVQPQLSVILRIQGNRMAQLSALVSRGSCHSQIMLRSRRGERGREGDLLGLNPALPSDPPPGPLALDKDRAPGSPGTGHQHRGLWQGQGSSQGSVRVRMGVWCRTAKEGSGRGPGWAAPEGRGSGPEMGEHGGSPPRSAGALGHLQECGSSLKRKHSLTEGPRPRRTGRRTQSPAAPFPSKSLWPAGDGPEGPVSVAAVTTQLPGPFMSVAPCVRTTSPAPQAPTPETPPARLPGPYLAHSLSSLWDRDDPLAPRHIWNSDYSHVWRNKGLLRSSRGDQCRCSKAGNVGEMPGTRGPWESPPRVQDGPLHQSRPGHPVNLDSSMPHTRDTGMAQQEPLHLQGADLVAAGLDDVHGRAATDPPCHLGRGSVRGRLAPAMALSRPGRRGRQRCSATRQQATAAARTSREANPGALRLGPHVGGSIPGEQPDSGAGDTRELGPLAVPPWPGHGRALVGCGVAVAPLLTGLHVTRSEGILVSRLRAMPRDLPSLAEPPCARTRECVCEGCVALHRLLLTHPSLHVAQEVPPITLHSCDPPRTGPQPIKQDGWLRLLMVQREAGPSSGLQVWRAILPGRKRRKGRSGKLLWSRDRLTGQEAGRWERTWRAGSGGTRGLDVVCPQFHEAHGGPPPIPAVLPWLRPHWTAVWPPDNYPTIDHGPLKCSRSGVLAAHRPGEAALALRPLQGPPDLAPTGSCLLGTLVPTSHSVNVASLHHGLSPSDGLRALLTHRPACCASYLTVLANLVKSRLCPCVCLFLDQEVTHLPYFHGKLTSSCDRLWPWPAFLLGAPLRAHQPAPRDPAPRSLASGTPSTCAPGPRCLPLLCC